MADKKISALTGATTPLAGTEVLPIVQGGATVKVAVSDLTAGRAISATSVTATTGNFVVGTSGQGIDFSATPSTGTSELLADYEEGTWTPNQGGGLTVVGAFSSAGTYTKVGRLVTANFSFSGATSVSVAGGGNMCTNLPFTTAVTAGGVMARAGLSSGGTLAVEGGTANAWATSTIAATGTLFCSVTYIV
jgi:hypothetical protein